MAKRVDKERVDDEIPKNLNTEVDCKYTQEQFSEFEVGETFRVNQTNGSRHTDGQVEHHLLPKVQHGCDSPYSRELHPGNKWQDRAFSKCPEVQYEFPRYKKIGLFHRLQNFLRREDCFMLSISCCLQTIPVGCDTYASMNKRGCTI
jgi:hypothetical protein